MNKEKIRGIIQKQREFFATNTTKNIHFRLSKLEKLKSAVENNEAHVLESLKKDLNKSEFEAYLTEIGIVKSEIKLHIKNLKKWSKRKKACASLSQLGANSYAYKEPLGTVLIISPWNYPFSLSILPLIGAISAGNTAILKVSEFSNNTSKVLEKIISETFEEKYIKVVQGDAEVGGKLLDKKFDLIFFTGSTNVGKIVMAKAAKYLCPVVLELGGKSPVLVDKSANLKLAARQIVWGKTLNSGQTCIAPDYLLVHEDIKNKLIDFIISEINVQWGENIIKNDDFPRIISSKHFERLKNYLKDKDNKVLHGGKHDEKKLKIEPSLVECAESSELLKEEIFGPILPIITFDEVDFAINYIKDREKPLAFYFFSSNKLLQDRIIEEISFGGGCINDTIMHLASHKLPFGGVGGSGFGSYHGKYSFDAFSHTKSVVIKNNCLDLPLRYSPFTEKKLKIIKKLLG